MEKKKTLKNFLKFQNFKSYNKNIVINPSNFAIEARNGMFWYKVPQK